MIVSVSPDLWDFRAQLGGCHGFDDFAVGALGVGALFFVGSDVDPCANELSVAWAKSRPAQGETEEAGRNSTVLLAAIPPRSLSGARRRRGCASGVRAPTFPLMGDGLRHLRRDVDCGMACCENPSKSASFYPM